MKVAVAAILFGSFTLAPAQAVSVNLQAALLESQEGRLNSARLEAVWRPQEAALMRNQSNLDAARARFDQERRRKRGWHFWRHVMSKKQKQATAAALASKQKALDRREDLRVDFQARQIRIVNEIGKKMTAVAESYAKDHGLSLEYFDPAKRDHVWGTDITRELVQLYDRTYPAER